jgi:hypothetical protein
MEFSQFLHGYVWYPIQQSEYLSPFLLSFGASDDISRDHKSPIGYPVTLKTHYDAFHVNRSPHQGYLQDSHNGKQRSCDFWQNPASALLR